MHVGQTVLLAHAAIERLMLRMRMNVDQPRQYQTIRAVDDPVRFPGIITPDKSDRIAGKGDVDVAAVDVTSGAFVLGDEPIGFADEVDGHRSVLH